MARRAEIGASIAAALLALVTLLAALFLPLVPACAASAYGSCHARLEPLTAPAVRVEPAVWVYIALLAALTLAGALGGLLDGVRDDRRGLALLWLGTGLTFAGCALGALGVFGSLYLPSIVALLIAAAAAFARRRRPLPTRSR
ncbi:MAG TPA: hypothetical protein VGR57_20985 [Ktedonobacterales bacterium]|nr:hypothetical protein [Ktedonobacterales bacterium]